MLLSLQSPWDRVLQLAQPEVGVESALGEQRRTQRRVNMKGTDRDMETRQTSHRSPSSRSEGACLGSSASNSRSIYSCALCLAVIPGASWGPAVCQVSAGSEISILAVSKTLRLYRRFVLAVWSEQSTTHIPKHGSDPSCKMLRHTDHFSTAMFSETTWFLLIPDPASPLIIKVTPNDHYN